MKEDIVRFSIDIPVDLHSAVKIKCATSRIPIRKVIIAYLELFIHKDTVVTVTPNEQPSETPNELLDDSETPNELLDDSETPGELLNELTDISIEETI